MMRVVTLLMGIGPLLGAPQGWATAPMIYSASAYQSPVRGDPDDLLLLPGYGFASGDTVVYSAIADTTKPLIQPGTLPRSSTAALGIADVVSVVDAPYSLTIHLPEAMKTDQSYALWAVNSSGEWSNGIKINDARPLWITPDETYASASLAASPRVMKVVGRNLQPASGSTTQVRLVGAQATYRLPAEIDGGPHSAIDRYVAKVHLPDYMRTGSYAVQVSRDGASWVSLVDENHQTKQTLNVMADPKTPARFPVGRYTFGTCIPSANNCPAVSENCLPDPTDQQDQTLCIAAAIAAAHAGGGGVVIFGAGTWSMNSAGSWAPGQSFSSKGVSYDGLLVPDGVSIQGAGSTATKLLRGSAWDMHLPSFALLGHNTVSGLTFRDARKYTNRDSGSALLMLGVRWDRASAYYSNAPTNVSHVVITQDVFDQPYDAIANGGLSIDHLWVVNNEFGAFKTALSWEGNPANVAHHYSYSDSVVAYNKFSPGSYLDTSTGQGTIATELSGGYRTDFSNNVADGTSAAYLYDPRTDTKGWRAAYFWSMSDNVEMLLVSQNVATCSGDKNGDGEAIAYDNNHNRPGFVPVAVPVLAAASNATADTSTITVRGSLIEKQLIYGSTINVSPVADYYRGDWLQVIQGPGIGQARKIISIGSDADSEGRTVAFTVAPAFDVLPQPNSLITDGRIFWQAYTIDNLIDHRTPLCLKSNRKRQAGGLITQYAATTDSVVEGNIQYDSSGILATNFVQSFNEIRGNVIDGTYDYNDKTPQAQYGIAVRYAAAPDVPPPTMTYGLAISHNLVSRLGGSKGAISFDRNWFAGPESRIFRGVTPWKIGSSSLIFKNTLTDFDHRSAAGVGIGVSAGSPATPIEWRSVLYGNVCSGGLAHSGVVDLGTATVRVCPSSRAESCECTRQLADLAVTGTASAKGATVGGTVTYTLAVTNNGPGYATDATLSMELPAGLSVNSMTGRGATCDTDDSNVNLCRLGNISPGARMDMTVVATVKALGAVRAIFAVAHKEADANVGNDSIAISPSEIN